MEDLSIEDSQPRDVEQSNWSVATGLGLPGNLTGSENLKNFEQILLAAQQQQLRQLRRLQQLKKQTELTAARQAALDAKEQVEQLKKAKRQAELAEEAACKATQAADIEARRQAAQEAAAQQQEEYCRKLEEKLSKTKPRMDAAVLEYERRVSAAKSAARMQRTLARKEEVLEERRNAILSSEAAADKRMQHKHELRLLQEAIKREEDSFAEDHRRDIQSRAEADEAAKVAYYEAKQQQREQRIQLRQQEADLLKELKAEESKARSEYIRSRAEAVSEQDSARRNKLAQKLQEKLDRADALAAEREELKAHIKRILQAQELKVKQVVDKMAATGKLELPPELLVTLTSLENVVTSPYVSSSSSSPCSRPYSPALGGKVQPSSPGSSPRRVMPANLPVTAGLSPVAASQLQRQQEAALQRVLEEEILKEIERENKLQMVTDVEERKPLLRQFAAEREAAKARILQVGNQLLMQPASQNSAAAADTSAAAAEMTSV